MSCVPVRIVLTCEIAEEVSAELTATLVGIDGAPINGGVIDALTATLFDLKSGDILNGRDHVDAIADMAATISALGELVVQLEPDDNVIVDDSKSTEQHVLMLEWEWTAPGGQKEGKAEVVFTVRNFTKVPQAT